MKIQHLKFLFSLLVLCLSSFSLMSQEKQISALRAIIAKPANDTALVNAWVDLDNIIYISNPAEDKKLNEKILEFSEKKLNEQQPNKKLTDFYKYNRLIATNNLGIIYMYQSQNDIAKTFYSKALKYAMKMGNKQKLAACYNNFGVLYYRSGNYPKSIEFYTKGLGIMESTGDSKGLAGALNNIGNIYKEIGDTVKALSNFRKSLVYGIKADMKSFQSISYSAIAEIYADKERNDSAKILFKKSIELDRITENMQGLASDLANLSKLSLKKGELEDAKKNVDSALLIFEKIKDQRATGVTMGILASYYSQKGDLTNAASANKKALEMLMAIGQIEEAEKSAHSLYKIYKLKSDYKNAFETKELYDNLHDTLQNEKNTKAVLRQEFKYEYDKQTALDSIKHAVETKVRQAELDQKDAEIKVRRQVQITLLVGLLLILIFSIFLFNRFKVISKQKIIIEKQKTEVEKKQKEAESQKAIVEEKNREIVDSIYYAKRIQQALLPTEKYIDKNINRLNNSKKKLS